MYRKTIALLTILSFFIITSTSHARKPLSYDVDRFTGEQKLEEEISFGVIDSDFFYRGGNCFKLILSHKKGDPVSKVLRADLQGSGSSIPRLNPTGSYLGNPELFMLIDGQPKNIPIKEVNYVADFKSQEYMPAFITNGNPELQESHHHRIDFVLAISDEDLKGLSLAKDVAVSLRENLPSQKMSHDFNFKSSHIKGLRNFLDSIAIQQQ